MLLSYLGQFCQGLCIASITPLQAVHGTLREGSGTGKLAHITFSCASFRYAHQSWTDPLQLHRMWLYQGAKRKLLKKTEKYKNTFNDMLGIYTCVCFIF